MKFLRALASSVLDDQIDNAGAMMAYYAVLAIFPMLLFVVTLGLLVLPAETIDSGVRFAMEAAPSTIGVLVATQVDNMTKHAEAGFAIGSFVFALWGASRGASSLMQVLNKIYKKTETRHWVHRQVIALGLTAGLALMLIVAIALLVAGPALGRLVSSHLGIESDLSVVWTVVQWAGAGVLVMTVWALVYKFLPDTDAPLRIFTPGAFVGDPGADQIGGLLNGYARHPLAHVLATNLPHLHRFAEAAMANCSRSALMSLSMAATTLLALSSRPARKEVRSSCSSSEARRAGALSMSRSHCGIYCSSNCMRSSAFIAIGEGLAAPSSHRRTVRSLTESAAASASRVICRRERRSMMVVGVRTAPSPSTA